MVLRGDEAASSVVMNARLIVATVSIPAKVFTDQEIYIYKNIKQWKGMCKQDENVST
jgi:hypothetical protein